MKKIPMVLSLTILSLACGEVPTHPELGPASAAVLDDPVDLTLALGQVATVGTGVSLAFAAVVEDSRCPVGVDCFWEGNAVVEIALTVGGQPGDVVQINSTLEPRSFTRHGIRVTFRELAPRPPSEGAVPSSEYRLTVRVEEAG